VAVKVFNAVALMLKERDTLNVSELEGVVDAIKLGDEQGEGFTVVVKVVQELGEADRVKVGAVLPLKLVVPQFETEGVTLREGKIVSDPELLVEAMELGLFERDPVTHPDTLKVDEAIELAEVQTVEVRVSDCVWDPHPVEVGLEDRVMVADPEVHGEGENVPGLLPLIDPLVVSVGDWVSEAVVELEKLPLTVAVLQVVAEAEGEADWDRVRVKEAQLEGDCDTQVLGDPVPVEKWEAHEDGVRDAVAQTVALPVEEADTLSVGVVVCVTLLLCDPDTLPDIVAEVVGVVDAETLGVSVMELQGEGLEEVLKLELWETVWDGVKVCVGVTEGHRVGVAEGLALRLGVRVWDPLALELKEGVGQGLGERLTHPVIVGVLDTDALGEGVSVPDPHPERVALELGVMGDWVPLDVRHRVGEDDEVQDALPDWVIDGETVRVVETLAHPVPE